ncbi:MULTISPECIES: hypothetical protein [unclassified Nocardiopsis]|uniref:hypothetical protein n=1 Tax=Nocardiopsis TaxID=2013 RepID=UPI00387B8B08
MTTDTGHPPVVRLLSDTAVLPRGGCPAHRRVRADLSLGPARHRPREVPAAVLNAVLDLVEHRGWPLEKACAHPPPPGRPPVTVLGERVPPVHEGVRRWVRHAARTHLAATARLTPVPDFRVRQYMPERGSGHRRPYEVRATGRCYTHGTSRELWVPVPGRVRWAPPDANVAVAAYVLATGAPVDREAYAAAPGRYHGGAPYPMRRRDGPPERLRVVHVSCLDGATEVRFAGTADDAERLFAERGREGLRTALVGGARAPGADCLDCGIRSGCGRLSRTPGLLGLPPSPERRSWSPSTAREHALCPARAHFHTLGLPPSPTSPQVPAAPRTPHHPATPTPAPGAAPAPPRSSAERTCASKAAPTAEASDPSTAAAASRRIGQTTERTRAAGTAPVGHPGPSTAARTAEEAAGHTRASGTASGVGALAPPAAVPAAEVPGHPAGAASATGAPVSAGTAVSATGDTRSAEAASGTRAPRTAAPPMSGGGAPVCGCGGPSKDGAGSCACAGPRAERAVVSLPVGDGVVAGAVRAWLERAHERLPRRACEPADLPVDPARWSCAGRRLSGERALRATAMLAAHIPVCPLRDLPAGDHVRSGATLTADDTDADVLVVYRTDVLHHRRGSWVHRSVLIAEDGPPPKAGPALFAAEPRAALGVLFFAAGVITAGPEPAVEVEVLTPDGARVDVIDPASPPVLAAAEHTVRILAAPWHRDRAHAPAPGPACRTCPYRGWCPQGEGAHP